MKLRLQTSIFTETRSWESGESDDGRRIETETDKTTVYAYEICSIESEFRTGDKYGVSYVPNTKKVRAARDKGVVEATHAAYPEPVTYKSHKRELYIDTEAGVVSPFYENIRQGKGEKNPALLALVKKLL